MKRLLFILLFPALLLTVTDGKADDLRRKLVGRWCNPHTYELQGEFKGFHFKRNGSCASIGIPDLDLESWKVQDGRLIIRGRELDADGKSWKPYETSERIDMVNADSLRVVAQEKPFRLSFLYLKMKTIKKNLKVQADR